MSAIVLLRAHSLGALLATVGGAIWLQATGPMPVVRETVPLEVKAPFLYMLSAFPFLGILAADILLALREDAGKPRALLLMVQVGTTVLLSAIRLQWRIPVSGHELLLAFFVLRSWSLRYSAVHKGEMWVGLVVLMVLTGVKLLAWHDWVTVVWAIGIACVIWLAGPLTERGKVWQG